jgi:hypothetical protein
MTEASSLAKGKEVATVLCRGSKTALVGWCCYRDWQSPPICWNGDGESLFSQAQVTGEEVTGGL